MSSTGSARRTLRSNTGSIRRGDVFLSPLTMTDEPESIAEREVKKEKSKRRSRPGTPTREVSREAGLLDDGVAIKKEEEGAAMF